MADFGVWQKPGRHVHTARIPATTAGTDHDAVVFEAALGPCEIKRVAVIWDTDVTGASTNNFEVTTYNRGSNGAGSTALTTTKTYSSGVNASAHVAEELTLGATASLQDGDVVSFLVRHNGTGLASPDGMVVIEFEPR